jgi:spermidine synthase
MSARFEELGFEPTPMGELSLRRRRDPISGSDIYEVKLGDEYLMSSMFTAAEVELARLALGPLAFAEIDVLVGGLGLGFTALTVLDDDRVRTLHVVDRLAPVIDWHRAGLIPGGAALTADARCQLVEADFFAWVAGAAADDTILQPTYDAVVVDIDHSPRHVLNSGHEAFYTPAGTRRLAQRVRQGGVFALWSNDPPDDAYLAVLAAEFTDVRADVVEFPNPLQHRSAANTVYFARAPGP